MARRKTVVDLLADALEDAVEVLVEDPIQDLTELLRASRMPSKPAPKRRASLDSVLAELGMAPDGGWVADGEVARRPMQLTVGRVAGTDRVVARTQLSAPLPAHAVIQDRGRRAGGLVLGLKVDQAVLVGGSDRDELAAILEPAVLQGLLIRMTEDGCTLHIRGDQLVVGIPVDQQAFRVADDVRRAAAVANALERRILWRWSGLGDELRLAFDDTAPALSGRVRQTPVRVRYDRQSDRTEIEAGLRPLPAGTRIEAVRGAGSVALGDPILDPLLGFWTGNPAALAARVCTDAARGPLLELIRNHPGSSVGQDRILLVAPGLLQAGLRSAVLLVVELAEALSRGAPTAG